MLATNSADHLRVTSLFLLVLQGAWLERITMDAIITVWNAFQYFESDSLSKR